MAPKTKELEQMTQAVIDAKKARELKEKLKPNLSARVELITPEIAHEMLKKNVKHNRKVYDKHVSFLADQMLKNNWLVTHQGLAFDKDGNLQDGQHRLHSIIKSMTAQYMLVVRGLEPETFKVLDTGKIRSAKDVLISEGFEEYALLLASSSKLILNFQNKKFSDLDSNAAKTNITNWMVLDFVKKNHIILKELISHYSGLSGKYGHLMHVTDAAALTWLGARLKGCDVETTLSFFDPIHTGADLKASDPALFVRQWLIKQKAQHMVTIKTKHRLAMIIKGWNLYRNGRKVSKLWSYEKGEPFPLMK